MQTISFFQCSAVYPGNFLSSLAIASLWKKSRMLKSSVKLKNYKRDRENQIFQAWWREIEKNWRDGVNFRSAAGRASSFHRENFNKIHKSWQKNVVTVNKNCNQQFYWGFLSIYQPNSRHICSCLSQGRNPIHILHVKRIVLLGTRVFYKNVEILETFGCF